VLVFGDRGTGKSTAIRALAALMPKIPMVDGCPFNCDPEKTLAGLCARCEGGAEQVKRGSRRFPLSICLSAPRKTG
jgi:magnesium chelatase subunit I